MTVTYEEQTDVLYISIDSGPNEVICQELGNGVVLDLAENQRIVGIEILDASRRVSLDQFATLEYRKAS